MMADHKKLMMEIVHCPVAEGIRSGTLEYSPCEEIVQLQSGLTTFQPPEPWSGQIDIAPILFISSNPSIHEMELYPDASWDEERTVNFFSQRFTKGLCALHRDGITQIPVSYWTATCVHASEILSRLVIPGRDFALTEIVHCKSRGGIGMEEAKRHCADLYLKRVLSVSVAKVLVVCGAPARGMFEEFYRATLEPLQQNLSMLEGRMVVFLPHPRRTRWGVAVDLLSNVGSAGLATIRQHVRSTGTKTKYPAYAEE